MPDDDKPYKNYLEQFPEALRGQVEPIFQQWDKDVNTRFEKLHSDFEPYKQFVETGVDPDVISAGVDLLGQVNNDPQRVFTALADHLKTQGVDLSQLVQGFGGTPPVSTGTQESEYGDLPPEFITEFNNMKQMLELQGKAMVAQHQEQEKFSKAQEEQRALEELSTYLDKVAPSDKYPRNFILSYLAQGSTPEQAVESYTEWYQGQIGGQTPTAPRVAPGGGGLPSTQIDTSRMGSADTKQTVIDFLRAANLQG